MRLSQTKLCLLCLLLELDYSIRTKSNSSRTCLSPVLLHSSSNLGRLTQAIEMRGAATMHQNMVRGGAPHFPTESPFAYFYQPCGPVHHQILRLSAVHAEPSFHEIDEVNDRSLHVTPCRDQRRVSAMATTKLQPRCSHVSPVVVVRSDATKSCHPARYV